MLYDTHTHADYSCDSHMTLPQAIEAARQAGVGMILTEHWDREYPTNPDKFLFNLDEYFAKDGPLRTDTVLLGIEVGMQPSCAAADNAMLQQYPFDEVVASMHCMQGRDMYEERTYLGEDKMAAVQDYLEDSIRCLQLYPDFDTYGHIDYISRYMPYEDKHLYYAEHPKLWDEVFKLLIAGDKALEINTRRLDDPQALPPLQVLYQRFKKLGGKYVTLGSDAHYTEHVGGRLGIAAKLAKDCQLQIVHFKARQRILDK